MRNIPGQKLRNLIFHPYFVLAVLCILLMQLWISFYPGPYVSGDFSNKYLQVLDFEAHSYKSFVCRYPGKAIDPEFRFVPFRKPFFYHLKEGCFYHFPFQLTVLLAPFHRLAGIPGLYVPSIFAGMALLFLAFWIARDLGLSRGRQSAMIVLVFAASGLAVYAINPNEFAFTAALVSFAIFLSTKAGKAWLFLSGILAGFAVLLRAETAGLGLILPVSMVLFASDATSSKETHVLSSFASGNFWKTRKSAFVRAGIYLIGFFLLFAFFLYSNKAVTGYSLGLRGIEYIDDGKIEQGFSVTAKLQAIFLYLAGRKTAFLRDTPLLVLSLFVFFGAFGIRSLFSREAYLRIQSMIFSAFGFVASIVLLIPPNVGPQFAERFLFPVYPVLAAMAGLLLFAPRYRRIVQIAVLLLALFTLERTHAAYKKIKKNETGWAQNYFYYLPFAKDVDAVVLRQKFIMNMVVPDFPNRLIFLADTDDGFLELVSRLKKHGKRRILVLHSRPPFRGKAYNMPDTLVPEGFRYKTSTKDLGRRYFEMRKYEF